MADEPAAPAELPLTGGALPPVAAASAPAAAAPAEPAAAPAPEPAAPPVKEPSAPEPVKTAAETPSLLEELDAPDPKAAKPEVKAEEVKPDGDKPKLEDVKPEAKTDKPVEAKPGEKPAEVKPAEPVKPEPVSYEYQVPETIKMDDALKGEFHGALDAFRADPVKGSQGLIDLHNKAMTDYATHLAAEQQRVFAETRKEWRTQVMADEQLGGSGYQTTMKAIARMRDLAVPERDRPAFNEFLRITGAGDHPAFLRAMHNFARYMDEPSLPPPNPTPPPNNGRAPGRAGKVLYDNPRSSRDRQ